MSVNHSARSGGIIGISFPFSGFNMQICCAFSLESPNRGDFNEYTQYTIFSIIRKLSLVPNLQLRDFFQGTQERVRNRNL